MAESWCVQHAAIASDEHHKIEDRGAYGRGLSSLKQKTQQRRDYSEDGDLVPLQLQAANKIGRLLEEISCKLKDDARPEVRAECVQLWDRICRIGSQIYTVRNLNPVGVHHVRQGGYCAHHPYSDPNIRGENWGSKETFAHEEPKEETTTRDY